LRVFSSARALAARANTRARASRDRAFLMCVLLLVNPD
jgi:hypothetical protein